MPHNKQYPEKSSFPGRTRKGRLFGAKAPNQNPGVGECPNSTQYFTDGKIVRCGGRIAQEIALSGLFHGQQRKTVY